MEETPIPEEEELPELDPVDPLKRDPETEGMPGLDPVVLPVPPE
jgi:hypothetical protein